MQPLRFHFDYLSPYAYLAWTQIHALAERHRREVEPVPVLLAALLDHHGQKGPAEIPAKRTYVAKDTIRTAYRLGVPLAPPASHPFNPLLALRVSSLVMPPIERKLLIDGLFAATWAKSKDVTSVAVIGEVAREAGLDGAGLIALAGGLDAKERLRKQTDDAIAAGVFGVPAILADGELFWGLDSFDHLDRFLYGDDPVKKKTSQWASVTATATRSR